MQTRASACYYVHALSCIAVSWCVSTAPPSMTRRRLPASATRLRLHLSCAITNLFQKFNTKYHTVVLERNSHCMLAAVATILRQPISRARVVRWHAQNSKPLDQDPKSSSNISHAIVCSGEEVVATACQKAHETPPHCPQTLAAFSLAFGPYVMDKIDRMDAVLCTKHFNPNFTHLLLLAPPHAARHPRWHRQLALLPGQAVPTHHTSRPQPPRHLSYHYKLQ